jgi:hypothetical protein
MFAQEVGRKATTEVNREYKLSTHYDYLGPRVVDQSYLVNDSHFHLANGVSRWDESSRMGFSLSQNPPGSSKWKTVLKSTIKEFAAR